MRTEQIIYLAEIQASSSLIAASKNLHISVQALSSSISNLENELGTTLVNRSRHGSFLTANGLKLLDCGKIFLECLDSIKNTSSTKYPHLANTTIELFITNGMMETYFPPLASQFHQDFPHSRLNFKRATCTALLNNLADNTLNSLSVFQLITVNGENIIFCSDNITTHPLLNGHYYCMTHPNSKLYRYDSISLKTMLKYDTLVYSPSQDALNALINTVDGKKKISYISEFAVYQNMVQNGIGSSFISVADNCNYQYNNTFKLIPFKEKINFSVVLAYHAQKQLSLAEQEFVAYTQSFFHNNANLLAIKY